MFNKNTPSQSTCKRDVAIDYFKMLATLLVMNSHAEMMYPKFTFLASGGAIGDALFMFCSGFTLFIGTMGQFDNYYKRRLSRIVPSMVAVSILLGIISIINGENWMGINIGLSLNDKNYLYWILLFYIPLYFVKKYLYNRMVLVFIGLTIMVAIAYWLFPYKYETGTKGMWGSLYHNWKWFWYFVIMFWGAYIGSVKDKLKAYPLVDGLMTLLCLVGFYIFPSLAKQHPAIAPWQVLMIPMLMGFVFYFYKLLSADLFAKLYQKPAAKWIVLFIGGLCLESYLFHMTLFTPAFNNLFPLNLLLIYVAVIVCAYVVRCIARTILQTFQKENYRWGEVFKLV